MSKNRNAQLRYLVIDKCLSNRSRKWTWMDILEKVNHELLKDNPNSSGVEKTTIYEDLKDIEYRIYCGEIERLKEGRKTYLRYLDPSYSISKQQLTKEEITKLKGAITVLSRFKGLPQFEWMNEIIPAIEGKLGLVKTEKEIISFEENIYYTGKEHIPSLFNAIANKRVLKINYQDFKSIDAYEVEFHPYYLKQYNSRWFVFGYNSFRANQIQNLALDRIKRIEEISVKYVDSDINWEEYFSDIIGVTKFDTNPIVIKLLIQDAEQAAYIQTKPLHESQTPIKRTDFGFETSIKVIPNYELEKTLLSFGERIKIISPNSFQKKISNRIEKLYLRYQG
jgi:predicted DNA-binding transcriptional regulator YafY